MSAPTPDFALAYRDLMIAGFAREVEITKKVLAAVPEEKREYRPDPNARTAWELAWHIASADVHFLNSIANLKFDMSGSATTYKPKTIAEVVEWYDANVKRGLDRVGAMTAEPLLTPIPFFMYNLPAVFYLGFLNNHSIHHRGELATYLRPMGSKVPAIYGGSFDEPIRAAA